MIIEFLKGYRVYGPGSRVELGESTALTEGMANTLVQYGIAKVIDDNELDTRADVESVKPSRKPRRGKSTPKNRK